MGRRAEQLGSVLPRALYQVAEVAELLGTTPKVVRRWMKNGEIATVDMGGQLWVPLSALMAAASTRRREDDEPSW